VILAAAVVVAVNRVAVRVEMVEMVEMSLFLVTKFQTIGIPVVSIIQATLTRDLPSIQSCINFLIFY
jgi:hypothetical protein